MPKLAKREEKQSEKIQKMTIKTLSTMKKLHEKWKKMLTTRGEVKMQQRGQKSVANPFIFV